MFVRISGGQKKSTTGSKPITSHFKTEKTGKQISVVVNAKANFHTPDGLFSGY